MVERISAGTIMTPNKPMLVKLFKLSFFEGFLLRVAMFKARGVQSVHCKVEFTRIKRLGGKYLNNYDSKL